MSTQWLIYFFPGCGGLSCFQYGKGKAAAASGQAKGGCGHPRSHSPSTLNVPISRHAWPTRRYQGDDIREACSTERGHAQWKILLFQLKGLHTNTQVPVQTPRVLRAHQLPSCPHWPFPCPLVCFLYWHIHKLIFPYCLSKQLLQRPGFLS